MDLKNIREEYNKEPLDEKNVLKDPFLQFEKWFQYALDVKVSYVNAANLVTINQEGFPDSRIVLIKEITKNGPVFFTNYESSKAHDIEKNPKVGMNIYWKELDRQIRLTGIAKKISQEESHKYFLSRGKESQASALASPQSQRITKEELYKRKDEIHQKYPDENYPAPDFWGGYMIEMHSIEFWQGRPNRFHDRFQFVLVDGKWDFSRLAP